nr:Cu(I)-responsive transcriptional regulator [uncultured Moellerella sp.]
MNIGQAAKLSGISAKMIRYYEQIGLMPKALRSAAGYRYYCSADIDNLKFIRRARDLGFSVEQISALLSLWHQREGTHENVKAMALSHLSGLKTKIAELQTMAATLEQLARDCQGNNRPGCPIIAGLVESTSIIEPRSSQTPKFGVSSLTPLRNRSH